MIPLASRGKNSILLLVLEIVYDVNPFMLMFGLKGEEIETR
jgi:hypothetical protein